MSWLDVQMYPVPPSMDWRHDIPDESFSRRIDASVQRQELPYGYTQPSPSADTGDFNERKFESDKQYHIKSKS